MWNIITIKLINNNVSNLNMITTKLQSTHTEHTQQ